MSGCYMTLAKHVQAFMVEPIEVDTYLDLGQRIRPENSVLISL